MTIYDVTSVAASGAASDRGIIARATRPHRQAQVGNFSARLRVQDSVASRDLRHSHDRRHLDASKTIATIETIDASGTLAAIAPIGCALNTGLANEDR